MAETETPELDAAVRLFDDPEGKLLGFADLVIGKSFVIKGIRILMGPEKEDRPAGPFLSFPARRRSSGEKPWMDVAHPITTEAYQAARQLVLGEFERVRAGGAPSPRAAPR